MSDTFLGFYCHQVDNPFFSMEEANRVMSHVNSQPNHFAYYDSVYDVFIFKGTFELEIYEGRTIEMNGESIKVYPIGAGSWDWKEVKK